MCHFSTDDYVQWQSKEVSCFRNRTRPHKKCSLLKTAFTYLQHRRTKMKHYLNRKEIITLENNICSYLSALSFLKCLVFEQRCTFVLLKVSEQYSATSRFGITSFVCNVVAQMVPQSFNIYAQSVSINSGQNFRKQTRSGWDSPIKNKYHTYASKYRTPTYHFN